MDMNNPDAGYTEQLQKVELGQALQRLSQNQDFNMVIMEGYIINTLLDISENMLDIQPPVRQEALEQVQSVNYLKRYLTSVREEAKKAYEDMNEDQ